MNATVSPARRLAFHIEYEGTNYHGWQKQHLVSPTIQESLETALEDFFGVPCPIQGASRTDAGVHARDQVAAVTIAHPIRCEGFVKTINARLPKDIAIRHAREVEDGFNPRFRNQGKTYCYRLYRSTERQPLIERQSWRLQWDIDLTLMKEASQHLIGTHNFASFAASDGQHKTTDRTITEIDWQQVDKNQWAMNITGTAFLKHMVRNIVGTLVNVGRGQTSPDKMIEILAAQNRVAAGPTAPPHGLVLEHVKMMYET